jgi:methionyl-tRNA synthetase
MSEVFIRPDHKLGQIAPLFARVEDEDIKKHKEKLGTK